MCRMLRVLSNTSMGSNRPTTRLIPLLQSGMSLDMDEAQVALEPGIKFGKQSKSYARLNFATSRELLEIIVDRVLSVVD